MQLSASEFSSQLSKLNPKVSPERLAALRELARNADNGEADKNAQAGAVDAVDLQSGQRLSSDDAKGSLKISTEKQISKGWLKTVKDIQSEEYTGDKNVAVSLTQGTETSWSIFGWTFGQSTDLNTNFTSMLMP